MLQSEVNIWRYEASERDPDFLDILNYTPVQIKFPFKKKSKTKQKQTSN